jgi:hypothetical protein
MPGWLTALDTVLGVVDVATRRLSGRSQAQRRDDLAVGSTGVGPLEARLAGVVVAALKEAFDRDHRRLELEREQMESERRRAEQALQLELLRQAGEREIGRLRMVAGVAVAGWVSTLFFAAPLSSSGIGRALLAAGWVLLLGALGAVFVGQSRVTAALPGGDDLTPSRPPSSGIAGAAAPWLVVAGLAIIGTALLFPFPR